VATGRELSSEHVAAAGIACPKNIVKFWSTFGSFSVGTAVELGE
jgi:hypothetical protein